MPEAWYLSDPFLILGIDENASDSQIDEAFRYLGKNLNPTNFSHGSFAEQQAQQCISRIVPAYQALREKDTREQARQKHLLDKEKPFNPDDMKPFLGHICVAAGIITLDDLNEAISKQSDIDLPLGQILQEKALLSQTELEGLLMGQRLFSSPSRPLDIITQRLIAMSAVSRDMVKIVLIDQRTAYMSTVPELLIKRGWLDQRIFSVIADQAQTPIA